MKKQPKKKQPKQKQPAKKKDIQYNRQPQMWITGVPGSFGYRF